MVENLSAVSPVTPIVLQVIYQVEN